MLQTIPPSAPNGRSRDESQTSANADAPIANQSAGHKVVANGTYRSIAHEITGEAINTASPDGKRVPPKRLQDVQRPRRAPS